jgi:exodeoxyribonuclease VII small subunit
MAKENILFEENLEKLKEIVESLESGDLPLRESLEKFQNGVDIIKQCYKELETAELKIETIIKKDGKIITEPLRNK